MKIYHWKKTHNLYEYQKWKDEVANKHKLRLYNNIKINMVVEEFIKGTLTRVERSNMAQPRSGTLKINVELGKMSGLNLQGRPCPICKDGSIEDEPGYRCYLGVMHTATQIDRFLC